MTWVPKNHAWTYFKSTSTHQILQFNQNRETEYFRFWKILHKMTNELKKIKVSQFSKNYFSRKSHES